MNGHQIATPRDLAGAVANVQPGQEALLDIIRDGRKLSITVTLAIQPEPAAETSTAPKPPQEAGLGRALGTLSPALRKRLEVPEGTGGAVVMRVEPGSPADLAGLVAGDVIAGVGTGAVYDVHEATRAIRHSQQLGHVLLRVFRDGHAAFVAIEVSPSTKG